jgi:ABC-type sugar transport system permease subunit
MTKGGPLYQTETMALEMYRLTALKGDIGQGAAVTVILFTLSLVLAFVYVVLWRREARRWT